MNGLFSLGTVLDFSACERWVFKGYASLENWNAWSLPVARSLCQSHVHISTTMADKKEYVIRGIVQLRWFLTCVFLQVKNSRAWIESHWSVIKCFLRFSIILKNNFITLRLFIAFINRVVRYLTNRRNYPRLLSRVWSPRIIIVIILTLRHHRTSIKVHHRGVRGQSKSKLEWNGWTEWQTKHR